MYPLLFSYRDTLFGNGFVVEVHAANGRALCIHEADAFWMYGINPGGLAAQGADLEAAHLAFRQTFSTILIDLALASARFEDFEKAVRDFFDETNLGYESNWYQAIQGVQRGEITLANVQVKPADSPRAIQVSLKPIEQLTAQDNSATLDYRLAA